MKAYVGVTDGRWYRFLAERPHLTEANFWLPSGGPRNFAAIRPEEPFLFKTHHPHDRLVGGGILASYRQLPISLAWEAFGEANGVGSLDDLRRAIGAYLRRPLGAVEDPIIGCVMLRDVAFLPPHEGLGSPADFAKNIVQGKGYEISPGVDSRVEQMVSWLFDRTPSVWDAFEITYTHNGPMFGAPRQVIPRLGQDSFVAIVQDAYEMKCAITGAKIRPALQAAHIRSVKAGGQHRVDNGVLLRADVHIMFDRGLLGVDPATKTLHVSSRLRTEFGNGEEFYAKQGSAIRVPQRRIDQPNAEFLEWHMDTVFRA